MHRSGTLCGAIAVADLVFADGWAFTASVNPAAALLNTGDGVVAATGTSRHTTAATR